MNRVVSRHMKCVIQRVKHAKVVVDSKTVSEINNGIVTLMGVEQGDSEASVEKLIQKIIDLRIFEDAEGRMNLSLRDVNGSHLIVSQFTLAADCSSGRRPSFTTAEHPTRAKELYEYALNQSKSTGIPTLSGIFGADMQIQLLNDGPVTFILDSKDF